MRNCAFNLSLSCRDSSRETSMRKSWSFVCLAFASLAVIFADAQQLRAQIPGAGPQLTDPGSFRRVASDVNLGLPGRLWFESNLADQGLGYQGTYFSIGAKNRLFEDYFDGRWLGEARVHHSIEENGGLFANIGIERVFTVKSAKADVVTGFWYDYDGDSQGAFAHDFSQVGFHAAIKTKKWDLIGNGYFPVGVTDFNTAGPTGNNVFFGNNILLQPAIDSALQGFDVTFRMRPELLSFGNGIIDFGGYGYSSDEVNSFGGGRIRLGFQSQRGFQIVAEVNHDDRFETTGVLNIGYTFGGQGARGDGGYGLARDLEQTVRNDHIVRFNSQPTIAIDPDTGLAFNVVHVNNTADPEFGEGSFERPFASLAAAEANSAPGDVIYIGQGDGTRNGLNTGIALQDRQKLFGAGGDIFIPIQNDQLFLLPGTGSRSTISNPGGFSVVSLADDNQVRNINVDATGAQIGIYGNNSRNGVIADVSVSGAAEAGVLLEDAQGDWEVSRSDFSDNIIDGFFVRGNPDPSSSWVFEENTFDRNGFEGLRLEDYQGRDIRLVSNSTSDNGRHGLFFENFIGSGLDLDIIAQTADSNGANGIFLEGGIGDINIINTTATNTGVTGLAIENFTNGADDLTFIGNTEGGVSNITGNLTNNIAVEINEGFRTQDVLITGLTISDGGRGVLASVQGVKSVMNLQIVDNFEISRHSQEGVRLITDNSGVLNVLIENEEGTAPLLLNDNGQTSAAGIALFADGPLGQPNSQINATIRNVSINNDFEVGFTPTVIGLINQDGVAVVGTGASQVNLLVEDSRIESAGGIDLQFDNDGNGAINNTFFDDLIIRSDVPVNVNVNGGTILDLALTNSDIQSNGNVRTVATGGSPDASDGFEVADPFLDAQGDFGIVINVTGDIGGGFDTLARINFANNLVRDFTFGAYTLNTFGDAQVLQYLTSNQLLRNGPGIDNLIEFPVDDPTTFAAGDAPVNENEANFFDAIELNAFGSSRLSTRIVANQLVNNYELGIDINAFGNATVNASLISNTLANDIGQDADATAALVSTSFDFDFDATNNGLNSSVCLELSSNSFRSAALFNQFSMQDFVVELDGASNGITDADLAGLGLVTDTVGICEGLINDEELFFAANGFVDANTPPGGGFQPIDHD